MVSPTPRVQQDPGQAAPQLARALQPPLLHMHSWGLLHVQGALVHAIL